MRQWHNSRVWCSWLSWPSSNRVTEMFGMRRALCKRVLVKVRVQVNVPQFWGAVRIAGYNCSCYMNKYTMGCSIRNLDCKRKCLSSGLETAWPDNRWRLFFEGVDFCPRIALCLGDVAMFSDHGSCPSFMMFSFPSVVVDTKYMKSRGRHPTVCDMGTLKWHGYWLRAPSWMTQS